MPGEISKNDFIKMLNKDMQYPFGQEHADKASQAYHAGHYVEAIKEYHLALKTNPSFVDWYWKLGVAYEHNGNLQEAIGKYREAIGVEKNYYYAYILLARALIKSENIDEAFIVCNHAITLEPGHGDDALTLLGFILLAKGDIEGAILRLHASMEIIGSTTAAYGLGIAAFMQGKYAEALSFFELTLPKIPFSSELLDIHYHIARCLSKFGNISRALLEFEIAVNQNDSSPDIYYWYADTLTTAGEIEKAKQELQTTYRLNPGFHATLFRLDDFKVL